MTRMIVQDGGVYTTMRNNEVPLGRASFPALQVTLSLVHCGLVSVSLDSKVKASLAMPSGECDAKRLKG